MRYVIAHQGTKVISQNVVDQLAAEQSMGLHKPETYQQFRSNVEKSRDELVTLLRDIRIDQGKRIVAYGATSKSTTVTNYCGIGPELVEFISDTTPTKQGKFSPGTHIPVYEYARLAENYPEYLLLFAWNHAAEIMEKEQAYSQSGGKWIVYVPEVGIVS